MKLSLTLRVAGLFILLNQPSPALPYFSNFTLPTNEPDEPFLYTVGRQKLIDAQYKCYHRMEQLPPYEGEGPYCNRTWDGWMCWDDTPAGVMAYQLCPDYFPDFDPAESVTKYCDENGDWFKHPDSNRTWSNYTMCNAFTPDKLQNAYVLYYLALVGHSLSIFTLVISLGIFVCFRSLSCQRVTLHKHMFLTYILNSMIIIIHLVEVIPNGDLVRRDPVGLDIDPLTVLVPGWSLADDSDVSTCTFTQVSCKILHFFHQYMMACNYFWMLCEGIYLHTLIVVSVFTEEQRLRYYYFLGWGFPLVPTVIHAITRALYYDDNCWLSVETHLLYIIHGPVMAALVVNFFFLLNIVRVLVTKMRETHEAESHMYLKAVKATMVLVPLLGIQFVVFPWRPSNKILGKIYDYLMHSLIHFQGFFVATIYCFCNNEVQTTLKRQWTQFKLQHWGTALTNRTAPQASPAATASAEAGDIDLPVYICHREPPRANNQVLEGAEIIPLNTVEQESSA